MIGKFNSETPVKIWIEEFVCLGKGKFSFKCGYDSQNEINGISKPQSQHFKFVEY